MNNQTLNNPTGFALSKATSGINKPFTNIPLYGFNDLYLDSQTIIQGVGQGNIATVANIQDLEQTTINNLWLYINEYEFDTSIGISWNAILNNNFVEEGFVTYQISNAILSFNNYLNATQLASYGIKGIDSIIYNLGTNERESRTLTASIEITLNNNQTLKFDNFKPFGMPT